MRLRKVHVSVITLTALAAASLVFTTGRSTPHAAATPKLAAAPTLTCVYRDAGALPDPHCTPGATNPAVTQRTIAKTICKAGWTSTVRPPESVTEPEKFASMRAYGVPTTAGHAGLYEYDHLISLELGGAVNDTRNLWPEPHTTPLTAVDAGSFAKDKVENRLHAEVCAHKITLAVARKAIRTDWRNPAP